MDTWIWLAIAAFVVVDGFFMLFFARHMAARRARNDEPPGDDASPDLHV